jgi:hypothetical protein
MLTIHKESGQGERLSFPSRVSGTLSLSGPKRQDDQCPYAITT